ncbi:MAG: hypothetical protein IPG64_27135 [Haliea sp.]|nr:hypothetical protein [Haliea sp.]MBK6741267.1 hypothetical protein [Haliea sp.]
MLTKEAIIATTHRDSEGDKLALEALYSLVDGIRSSYIPIWDEHDPRKPPLGRIASAEVRERNDGEYEVFAILEIFDGSEPDRYSGEREHIREKPLDVGQIVVSPDRTFMSKEDLDDINVLAKLLGTSPIESVKKAMDPLSILQLTAAFVAGGVASGFLGKLGSDAADALKEKIKRIMRRAEERTSERVFRLVLQLEKDGYSIEADIFITNPTDEDIDSLFSSGLSETDKQIPKLMNFGKQLSKLTFEYKDNNLQLKFGVRKDCVPVIIKVEDTQNETKP